MIFMQEMQLPNGIHTIEQITNTLLHRHFLKSKVRCIKVVELSAEEMKSSKFKHMKYAFWSWVEVNDETKMFLFCQFVIDDRNVFRWGYQSFPFVRWAKMAYGRGWFDRENISDWEIEVISNA